MKLSEIECIRIIFGGDHTTAWIHAFSLCVKKFKFEILAKIEANSSFLLHFI